MAIGLLEDAADARDVFYGKAEHDKIHGRLGHHVVLLQVVLNLLTWLHANGREKLT